MLLGVSRHRLGGLHVFTLPVSVTTFARWAMLTMCIRSHSSSLSPVTRALSHSLSLTHTHSLTRPLPCQSQRNHRKHGLTGRFIQSAAFALVSFYTTILRLHPLKLKVGDVRVLDEDANGEVRLSACFPRTCS